MIKIRIQHPQALDTKLISDEILMQINAQTLYRYMVASQVACA